MYFIHVALASDLIAYTAYISVLRRKEGKSLIPGSQLG